MRSYIFNNSGNNPVLVACSEKSILRVYDQKYIDTFLISINKEGHL